MPNFPQRPQRHSLNTDQFGPIFHGTSGYVKDSGTILPPSVHGQESHWAGSRPHGDDPAHLAFATPSEHVAWDFAMQRPRLDTRPRVYEVEHAHDEREGRDLGEDEVVSPTGFPIKKRIDTMPGHQGTFPQINWADQIDTRIPGHDALWSDNVNHPSDDEIEHGHNPGPKGSTEERLQQHLKTLPPGPDPHQGRLF